MPKPLMPLNDTKLNTFCSFSYVIIFYYYYNLNVYITILIILVSKILYNNYFIQCAQKCSTMHKN